MSDPVRVVADIPGELHRDVKALGKKTRMSIAALITASLRSYVEQYEIKEQERRERNTVKRKLSTARALTPLDERPAVDVPVAEAPDRLAATFEKHALRIMEAHASPPDLALRRQEAFAAIKRMAPLSYGGDRGDAKIVERLESVIAAKLNALENGDDPPTTAAPMPLVEPAPRIAPPSPPLSIAADSELLTSTLASLARILQQSAEPDPLVGTHINPRRVRTRSAILSEEENA